MQFRACKFEDSKSHHMHSLEFLILILYTNWMPTDIYKVHNASAVGGYAFRTIIFLSCISIHTSPIFNNNNNNNKTTTI